MRTRIASHASVTVTLPRMRDHSHPTAVAGALQRLADQAAGRHGVFTRQEALDHGVSGATLSRQVRDGRYVRVGPGVYRVRGHPETWLSVLVAATEATGGVAARRSALALHRVAPTRRSGRPAILVPYGGSVRVPVRARMHRSRTLDDADRTAVEGIPCCTIARALVDHGPESPPGAWRELAAEAVRTGRVTFEDLHAQLDRAGRLPHVSSMRTTLEGLEPGAVRARSGGETAFVALLADAGLPRPLLNYELHDRHGVMVAELDAAYVEWWQAFELDGAPFHSLPGQLERDEMKDLRVRELGWDVRRVPARAVTRSPAWVVRRVSAAIEQAQETYSARRRAATAPGR